MDTRYYLRSEKVAIHTKGILGMGYAINRTEYSVIDRFSNEVLARSVDYFYNISPKHPTSVWRDCGNYSERSWQQKLDSNDPLFLNTNQVNVLYALDPIINKKD